MVERGGETHREKSGGGEIEGIMREEGGTD